MKQNVGDSPDPGDLEPEQANEIVSTLGPRAQLSWAFVAPVGERWQLEVGVAVRLSLFYAVTADYLAPEAPRYLAGGYVGALYTLP